MCLSFSEQLEVLCLGCHVLARIPWAEMQAESLPLGLVRSAVCVLHSGCAGLNFIMFTSN